MCLDIYQSMAVKFPPSEPLLWILPETFFPAVPLVSAGMTYITQIPRAWHPRISGEPGSLHSFEHPYFIRTLAPTSDFRQVDEGMADLILLLHLFLLWRRSPDYLVKIMLDINGWEAVLCLLRVFWRVRSAENFMPSAERGDSSTWTVQGWNCQSKSIGLSVDM